MKRAIRKAGALGVVMGILAGMVFGAGITARDVGAHNADNLQLGNVYVASGTYNEAKGDGTRRTGWRRRAAG